MHRVLLRHSLEGLLQVIDVDGRLHRSACSAISGKTGGAEGVVYPFEGADGRSTSYPQGSRRRGQRSSRAPLPNRPPISSTPWLGGRPCDTSRTVMTVSRYPGFLSASLPAGEHQANVSTRNCMRHSSNLRVVGSKEAFNDSKEGNPGSSPIVCLGQKATASASTWLHATRPWC
jgi:hypothetical protein